MVALVNPKENTVNWLSVKITHYDSPKDAIDSVVKTIEFELKFFHIIRLDDHISDLIESTRGSKRTTIDAKYALEKLDSAIQAGKELYNMCKLQANIQKLWNMWQAITS